VKLMIFLRNLIFNLEKNRQINSGKYRVLDIYDADSLKIICLFNLGVDSQISKPFLIESDILMGWYKEGILFQIEDELPNDIFIKNDQDLQKNIDQRNKAYELIEDLVNDKSFLLEFSSNSRSRLVIDYAKKKGVQPLKIYRLLRKYWQYGQVPDALLQHNFKKGGKGKDKRASDRQRGKPINNGKYNLRTKISINITDVDKGYFIKSVEKHIKEHLKFKLSKAYSMAIEDYYAEEVESAVRDSRVPQVPTIRQFSYWVKKLFDKNELLAKQFSESTWKKDHKGSISSVSENAKGPGTRYEIDATIADVYIVSDYDRNIILGRPTIYTVVDQASRMVAGIHISLEFASWIAARQVLYNACVSKVSYCKRYGIDITQADWPCLGTPARLLADRGEMIGEKPKIFVKSFGTKLEIAPPYRADCKSIVERRFGIANDEALHFLPGTTLGELRKRGEKDPRLDAVLTLNEVTKIIVSLFINHNKTNQYNDLVTKDLVKANLAPTPINYWNYYVERHQHGLNNMPNDKIIALLMGESEASVTERGIVHNGMRYSCGKAEKEDWFSKARNFGRWVVECRSDESWTNNIYIREDNDRVYLKCYLLDADKILYSDQHMSDIIYLSEWKKEKKEIPDKQYAKIEHSGMVKDIVDNAKKEKNATPSDLSKTASISNIRKNRQEELNRKSQKQLSEFEGTNNNLPLKTNNIKNQRILSILESISEEDE